MNCRPLPANHSRKLAEGLTLMELLVATGISSLLLATVGALSIYGARTFVAIGNYSDLEAKSRNVLDVVSRELRQTTAVIACQTNLPVKTLTLLADAGDDTTITNQLTWDAEARTFELKIGNLTKTLLTDCDGWEFAFYNRVPNLASGNISFNPAFALSDCKLIDMSWRCSRTMAGKTNAESVQGMQIVLRNKVD